MNPYGTTLEVNGAKDSGFLLTKLSGPSAYMPPEETQSPHRASSVTLMAGGGDGLTTQTFRIGRGTYDVKTLSNLFSQTLTASGTQQIISRFTALDQGRMMVQMTIQNFDKNSHPTNSFSTSGYLYRQ